MTKESYLKFADKISDNVGAFLLKDFGKKQKITHKEETHYGIKNDKLANDMYEAFLKKSTPEISLYTEEGEKSVGKNLTWVVDPIEGTSNYRAGNPFFATQIALLSEGEPILAVVYAPALNMKFISIKGKGTYLNGKRRYVSDVSEMNLALIDVGRGTSEFHKTWYVKTLETLITKIRTNRNFGACGLCCAMCAAGVTDCYINFGSQPYDYLSGALLIREGGGVVQNFSNDKWQFTDKEFIGGPKLLVDKVLDILK